MKVRKGIRAHKAHLVARKGHKVIKVLWVPQVLKVLLEDHRVIRESRVLQGARVPQEQKVTKVTRVLKVHKEHLEGHKAREDFKVIRET